MAGDGVVESSYLNYPIGTQERCTSKGAFPQGFKSRARKKPRKKDGIKGVKTNTESAGSGPARQFQFEVLLTRQVKGRRASRRRDTGRDGSRA